MNRSLLWFCGIRRGRVGPLVSGLFAATTSACGVAGEGSGALVVAERDSAGVRIVELSDVYNDSLPKWRIEERLAIGEAIGSPDYELSRVVGATVLRDGSIAVANRGSAEIRVFDADGQHIRTFGREGEGPGEFRGLSWLGLADGDTLVTFDDRLHRATWFTERGDVVRILRIEPEDADPANATPYGITSVQPVGIARGRLFVRAGYLRRTGEGEYRDTLSVAVVDEHGAWVDSLGLYAGRELFYHAGPSGVTFGIPPIFGRDSHVAAFAGRLVAGSTERFELDVYEDSALQMKVIARVDVAPGTRTEVEAWRDDRREGGSHLTGEGAEVARFVRENAPVRETPPVFQRLAVDSERSIWVEEPYRVPDGPSRWIVLAADGTPKARVVVPLRGRSTPTTPPDLTIFEIGEEYILGLRRDEYEVEQVVVYGFERQY